MSAKLISLIGPPASGKTTVAELLAAELPAELIREDYAGNPFLAESYVGDESSRLPGQLYFLMSRVKQLSAADWPERGTFVSDYGYCQDRLFARLRLGPDDRRLYERLARRIDPLVHPPDLLIHLDAPVEALLRRIDRRGRSYEKAMTREFLSLMRGRYNALAGRGDCPVILIDTESIDLRDREAMAGLVSEIRAKL